MSEFNINSHLIFHVESCVAEMITYAECRVIKAED